MTAISRGQLSTRRGSRRRGPQRNVENADAGSAPGALFVIILIRGFHYHATLDTGGANGSWITSFPPNKKCSLLFAPICCAATFSLMKAPRFRNLIKYGAPFPVWLNQVMTRRVARLISSLRHDTNIWVWRGRNNDFWIHFWNTKRVPMKWSRTFHRFSLCHCVCVFLCFKKKRKEKKTNMWWQDAAPCWPSKALKAQRG